MDPVTLLFLFLFSMLFASEFITPLIRALATTIEKIPPEHVKAIIIESLGVVENLGRLYLAWKFVIGLLDFLLKLVPALGEVVPTS